MPLALTRLFPDLAWMLQIHSFLLVPLQPLGMCLASISGYSRHAHTVMVVAMSAGTAAALLCGTTAFLLGLGWRRAVDHWLHVPVWLWMTAGNILYPRGFVIIWTLFGAGWLILAGLELAVVHGGNKLQVRGPFVTAVMLRLLKAKME